MKKLLFILLIFVFAACSQIKTATDFVCPAAENICNIVDNLNSEGDIMDVASDICKYATSICELVGPEDDGAKITAQLLELGKELTTKSLKKKNNETIQIQLKDALNKLKDIHKSLKKVNDE
jgi:hypothetical protein